MKADIRIIAEVIYLFRTCVFVLSVFLLTVEILMWPLYNFHCYNLKLKGIKKQLQCSNL